MVWGGEGDGGGGGWMVRPPRATESKESENFYCKQEIDFLRSKVLISWAKGEENKWLWFVKSHYYS